MIPLHGWLILDKPVGLGSTQAVGAVKRALRAGGCPGAKVGHGGTLDPLASGVLPIAIGEATKLSGRMLGADKAYDFTIAFGVETDTLDAEGAAVAESIVRPTPAEVEAVLPRFTGAIGQMPPAYSALKVAGRRAYDLARSGETVELAERRVIVRALRLAGEEEDPRPTLSRKGGKGPSTPSPAFAGEGRDEGFLPAPRSEITLSARVSKGTYIRSLARDIARALGTVGHVAMLRRTRAGPFTLAQAISLDKLAQAAMEGGLRELLLPLTAGLDDIPVLAVSPEQATALRQGRRLAGTAAHSGLHLAMLGAMPVALVEAGEDVRVVRGLNPMSE